MSKVTKFASLISNGDAALSRRAGVLETQAKIAQQSVIDTLKRAKSNLEIKIINMTDFAPESTDSLRPGSVNFNSDEWAKELQKAKIDLWRLDIAIATAQETYDEFFTETKNEE